MKKLMVILFSLFLCVTLYAQDKNSFANLWEYSAPEAPHGYQSGTIDIKEVDGKFAGEITIQGSAVSIQEFKQQNGNFVCNLFIDGQEMEITLLPKGKNKLEGKASGGGMDIPFTCKPVKP